MDPVKICPICHSEYYPDVLVCADCQVSLEWPGTQVDLAPLQDEGGWDQFAADEILGQLAGDTEKIIGIYRANLSKAGIPSAILPLTRLERTASGGILIVNHEVVQVPVGELTAGFQFLVFGRQHDLEAAQKIIQDLSADLHPDGELYNEYEIGKCPACEADLPEEATECPDCGLPFTFAPEEDGP